MELGYLTRDGNVVVVESLGSRILHRAYRIREAEGKYDFLKFSRPMESIGRVHVTVFLHRNGWSKPGELLLRRSEARFHRTRTSHILLGDTWRSLRKLRMGTTLTPATFSPKDILLPLPVKVRPRGRAPFCVMLHDGTVKGIRQSGASVEVYATEQKEFTDFVLGKVRLLLEFPTAEAATAFARHFAKVDGPGSIDPSVKVEIDRDRRVVWDRRMKLSLSAILLALTLVVVLPSFYVGLTNTRMAARAISFGFPIFLGLLLGLGLREGLETKRQEHRDLAAKWPRIVMERLQDRVPGMAASFVQISREMGLPLKPDLLDVKSLDAYLRSLTRESFFPPFAQGAAAYVGMVLMDNLGREVEHVWRYHEEQQAVVVWFPPIQLWVSPYQVVREIWGAGGKQTLDDFLNEMTEDVLIRFALSDIPGFQAFGFLNKGFDDVDELVRRVHERFPEAQATVHVVNDGHFHRRARAYGDFELQYVQVELEHPSGAVLRPAVILPFHNRAQTVRGSLDGSSSVVPGKDDVAVVRLERNELVPLGVQVYNFVEVGPIAGRSGTVELQLIAVADEAQVVTPRMRAMRDDAKDFLAPRDPNPEGMPTGPYGNFVGRVLSVEGLENPYQHTAFWRVALDITGFQLAVLVRKDRCSGMPEVGHFLAGSVWLLGRMASRPTDTTRYIG